MIVRNFFAEVRVTEILKEKNLTALFSVKYFYYSYILTLLCSSVVVFTHPTLSSLSLYI